MKKSMKQVIIHLILFSVATACYAKAPDRIVLRGGDANIEGTILRYWQDTNHLGNWFRPEDIIRLKIPELDEGKYKAIIKYACPDENGGKVSIKFNEQEFKRTFGSTGSWQTTMNKTIGYFEHDGGSVDIAMTILKQNGENQAVIDLHSMTLEKM
ncbi:MAG: hypothetical protein K9M54_01980 [Kiritimatiellales bacterium]|nr:hypothetical protein [Kiritimatiellales bacterium]MCF7864307.1 hypothetical protein [Kiritimatiellales bacterium]